MNKIKIIGGHKIIFPDPGPRKKEPIEGLELKPSRVMHYDKNGKLVTKIVELYRPIGNHMLDPE